MTTVPNQTTNETAFDHWAILELLGHRRLAGRVTEAQIAGASFLRIDVPSNPPATQFYAPGSVYAITPTTEDIARAVALGSAPAPVQRWELPAPAIPPQDDSASSEPDPYERNAWAGNDGGPF